ncbi:TPA: lpg1484 family Dot/Icm T4SS effector [Legionella pneumophila subsp. pneumophila]|uniref:lpg1484 family Dot/Icm T4SS effector n=1 Tax=Legionella pneumophila TaxID=446 RepID=UPI0009AC0523|nr:lpg1484 family Dot/Icm T4SS effector [Legionella pneumophila]RYW84419.1 hypothetical protein D7216_05940 [Legionella pneumophila]RYW85998.1 hypothetical protein D7221_13305 [Legionella pneumophila]HAT2038053.1 lpg1484 family Dot/Icm T4SS effector [Legionella pneumophila]HAT8939406.1 lpg1484 family Dot/Icm T4SS effector [Legionella pneumophila subsp. pneumophila]HAT9032050.1 lpg1484 family Dot/Icm T4SS effector [Legionella pneumophila subsp. pneumophila]
MHSMEMNCCIGKSLNYMRFSMSSFKHSCEKIDINLAHNVLTICPKNREALQRITALFNNLYILYFIGGIPSITYDDMDQIQINIKYSQQITDAKLKNTLLSFVNSELISQDEKETFLNELELTKTSFTTQFNTELENIRKKAEELSKKAEVDPYHYESASKAANRLHQELLIASQLYFYHKTPEAYENFKQTCQREIERARPVLEQHRGWKPLLVNVGAAIIGLGVLYLLAASINYYKTEGRHFFFHFETDSLQKLENLNMAQSQVLRI